MRTLIVSVAAIWLQAGLVQPAAAQGAAAANADRWQIVAAPYMWLLSVSGDATVRGTSVPVDTSFSDILENLNIALMGQIELRKGPFGVFINPLYSKLEADNTAGPITVSGPLGRRDVIVGPVDANTEAGMFLMDFGAFYRVGEWRLSEQSFPRLRVEPYAGGRLVNLSVDLSLSGAGGFARDISKSNTWVDPIIGFRSQIDLSETWNAVLIADVGGFGVASDLTWQVYALLGYRFGMFHDQDANLLVGYRALYVDYESGSGSSEIGLDVTMHGPIIGLSVTF